MNYYVHDVPGRLRIRSPHVKNNRGAAGEVENLILGVVGVNDVAINLTTGSCLVNYDPKAAKRDDIISVLHREGYFDPSRAMTNDEYICKATEKFLNLLTTFI